MSLTLMVHVLCGDTVRHPLRIVKFAFQNRHEEGFILSSAGGPVLFTVVDQTKLIAPVSHV